MIPLVLLSAMLLSQPTIDGQVWECTEPVPPQKDAEVATGFGEDSVEGFAQAYAKARRELETRLCQGLPCPGLTRDMLQLFSGRGHGRTCVAAAVKKARVQEWTSERGSTEDTFAAAARTLLSGLHPYGTTRLRVAITNVDDALDRDGTRTLLLKSLLIQALEQIENVEVVDPSSTHLITINGAVAQHATKIFVTWHARETHSGQVRASGPLFLPTHLAWLPSDDQLRTSTVVSLGLLAPTVGGIALGLVSATQAHSAQVEASNLSPGTLRERALRTAGDKWLVAGLSFGFGLAFGVSSGLTYLLNRHSSTNEESVSVALTVRTGEAGASVRVDF